MIVFAAAAGFASWRIADEVGFGADLGGSVWFLERRLKTRPISRAGSLASGGGGLVQQAGAEAEAPELGADRRFAAEALGVASRQRLPAGVVGQPQRPRCDGGKGGERRRLRLTT
jgi:hypothetical protein